MPITSSTRFVGPLFPPPNQVSVCNPSSVTQASAILPPYCGFSIISPVAGSRTISLSPAAAGSSSLAAPAQRPVAVSTMTNATAKVILNKIFIVLSIILILRVLRSGLPLPGYSRARNADGQSESNS